MPEGCDLALLSAIIHQNSPEENAQLYAKIHAALVPGGTLLIRDHIMDPSRTKPPAGAMFAINMLVNTRGGDCYTFQEVEKGLEAAGFAHIRQVRRGGAMDCLVEARKPTSRLPGFVHVFAPVASAVGFRAHELCNNLHNSWRLPFTLALSCCNIFI